MILGYILLAYTVATVISDVPHYALHRCAQSRFSWLRAIGSLHQVHHDFWNRNLEFNDEFVTKNYWYHHFPEYLSLMAGTVLLLPLFPKEAVVGALSLITAGFIGRGFAKGRDSNHRKVSELSLPKFTFLVGLRYHARHHVFPDAYFGSTLSVFDALMGTMTPIRKRRFLMSGSSGALGRPLKRLLEAGGAAEVVPLKYGEDYTHDDYSKVRALMAEADVLVLCHGAKGGLAFEANATSFVTLIEMFREARGSSLVPPEVWAVGSEIECHPAFGHEEYYAAKRAYARVARWYYWQNNFVYRHIVPSAFTSPMGRGLMSGAMAARLTLFLIRRGFRYVPVTYSGVALLNYFKFLFRVRARTPTEFLNEIAGGASRIGRRSPLGQGTVLSPTTS